MPAITARPSSATSSRPIGLTRMKPSTIMPLSRTTSRESPSEPARGRSTYTRELAGIDIALRFFGRVRGNPDVRHAHQAPPDVGAVSRQRLGDVRLADAVEVSDRPIELLQRILRRDPIALRALVGSIAVSLFFVELCRSLLLPFVFCYPAEYRANHPGCGRFARWFP